MKTIGKIDFIDLPEFGIKNIEAKIDTGANRSSLHCLDIKTKIIEGKEWLTFKVPFVIKGTDEFKTDHFFKKNVKSSSGHVEDRFIIKTEVVLFGETIETTFSLTNREDMKFPILLGCKLLKGRFTVDVAQKNLSFKFKNINE